MKIFANWLRFHKVNATGRKVRKGLEKLMEEMKKSKMRRAEEPERSCMFPVFKDGEEQEMLRSESSDEPKHSESMRQVVRKRKRQKDFGMGRQKRDGGAQEERRKKHCEDRQRQKTTKERVLNTRYA